MCDVVFVVLSFLGALWIRVDDDWVRWVGPDYWLVLGLLALGSVLIWVKLGLYRAVIRYLDVKVLANIFWGAIASVALAFVLLQVLGVSLPRSVPFIYFTLIMILVAGSRLLVRGLIHTRNHQSRTPVAIYGAGAAGRQLSASLLNGIEFHPLFFVDDDSNLHGSSVNGIRVFPPDMLPELVKKHQIDKVLFAIPSVPERRRREIFNNVQALRVELLTIPGHADLISGKVSVSQLRQVDIHDLLGREPVEPNQELLTRCIRGKTVLVTGAGGSIGSELARQIVAQQPETLLLLDVSEYQLYKIHQELQSESSQRVIPVLGSVLDRQLLNRLFAQYRVDTVYHAAAYKHVPMVEDNICAGVANNVSGTRNIAQAAAQAGVGYVVIVSTDKAVRPTNVMGASKRIAELVVQGLAREHNKTAFSIVRFGNVLGSSGSVIPLFRQQIETGGPVTVTHPDVTRYFMTIPEAAALVIQAGAVGPENGTRESDVFVLDMGEPVRIIDLAQKMVHLMGYEVITEANPDGDIAIEVTGLRPGEKLYEELLIEETATATSHPRILRAQERSMEAEPLQQLIDELEKALATGDSEQVLQLLQSAPVDFRTSRSTL